MARRVARELDKILDGCEPRQTAVARAAAFLDKMLKDGTPVVSLTSWFRDRHVEASRDGPGLRGGAALYYWPARNV